VKKISAHLYVIIALVAMAISSCQKDPSDTIAETNCQLSKAYYYDDIGNIGDSLIYTYTNNTLTKASNADGYMTFEYTNDKVTKRTLFATGLPGVDAYDTFTYNTDGTLATRKSYYSFNGQTIQSEQADFSYNAGKLVKYETKYYDPTTSQFVQSQTSIYTYTGNNITQAVVTDHLTPEVFTYTYSYDSNGNYHIKNNSLFTDFAFVDEVDGAILPVVVSANNITKVVEGQGQDETVLTYNADTKGNLTEWYFDGDLATKYVYDCK
jgi:hypothetical protein